MVSRACYGIMAGLTVFLAVVSCGKKEVPVLQVGRYRTQQAGGADRQTDCSQEFLHRRFCRACGNIGGIAAALSICASGRTVLLVEESDRIAGCFTPGDTTEIAENPYVGTTGSSPSYHEFRRKIGEWYARHAVPPPEIMSDIYPLLRELGAGGLCFETEAALDVINDMLDGRIKKEYLKIIRRHKSPRWSCTTTGSPPLSPSILTTRSPTRLPDGCISTLRKPVTFSRSSVLTTQQAVRGREMTGEPHAPAEPDSLYGMDTFCYNDSGGILTGHVTDSSVAEFDLTPIPA